MSSSCLAQKRELGVVNSAFIIKERLVTGQYGGYRYENCLTAALTDSELWLKPAAWIGECRPLKLPLGQIVCINISPGRPFPRVEVVYHDTKGPAACHFFPSELGTWMQQFQIKGIPFRATGSRLRRQIGPTWTAILRKGAMFLAGLTVVGGLLLSLLELVLGS